MTADRQRRLFGDQVLARHATREELLPAGTYDPLPAAVCRRTDLQATDKLLYGVLLGQLRGAATWTQPITVAQLADSIGAAERTVQNSLRRLEALDAAGRATARTLLEVRRWNNRPLRVAFAPLAPLAPPAGLQGPPEAPGRADLRPAAPRGGRTAPSAPDDDVAPRRADQRSLREGPGPVEDPRQDPDKPAPRAGAQTVRPAPQPLHPGVQRLHPGGADFAPTPLEHCTDTPDTDGAAQRPVSAATSIAEAARPPAGGQAATAGQAGAPAAVATIRGQAIRPADLAAEWADLLGLDERLRDEAQQDRDEADLRAIAADLCRGRLGAPYHAQRLLSTDAHQIGRRRPPARNPMGLFLAVVGELRRRRTAP